MSITGTPETPSRVGISVADIAAGMYALLGHPHRALRAATRTGTGTTHRRVALRRARRVDERADVLHDVRRRRAGADRRRARDDRAVRAASRPATATASTSPIQNDREWRRFCAQVLEQPGARRRRRGSPPTPQRVAHRGATARERSRRSFRRRTRPTMIVRASRPPASPTRGATRSTRSCASAARRTGSLARGRLARRAAARARAAGAARRTSSRSWAPMPALGQHTRRDSRRARIRRARRRSATRWRAGRRLI